MSLTERVHDWYIHDRRTQILGRHLANILPKNFHVLDVGCGDGLLAQLISQNRSDITLRGIDVRARDRTYVPIDQFDGEVIPYDDASFDGVMFVDVLLHTLDPMILLREAIRVARQAVVIKDHTLDGLLAGPTLRAMDWVGNSRYDVSLPYNYWTKPEWLEAFHDLGVKIGSWTTSLGLYPWPTSCLFDRSLHFVTRLELQHISAA
jgi:SAM-dependent methyltransferase